ncbi:MAG: RNA polymerase sigma factor [Phycisphaerales bacterium]|nr:RNA polymerase sigma factor [Phycisphaerales bacterium]
MTNGADASDGRADERLLADFLDGDERAFSQLIRRYDRELFQFVARFVRDSAAAEDIVQDTFIQVHSSAQGFDMSRRFRPWMFTIAANKARDHLRTRGRRKEVAFAFDNNDGEQTNFQDFLADAGPAPGDEAEAEEQRKAVRKIVEALPDHLREVLVLAYFHRFPYKEMAEMLEIPLGTVKSRLHAAVTKFAEAYKREMVEKTESGA